MTKARALLTTGVSLISLTLFVVTAVVPDWIEELSGLAPDAGNGSTEALITLAFAAITVISSLGAIVAWRKVSTRASGGSHIH